jgi:hypothetical protein
MIRKSRLALVALLVVAAVAGAGGGLVLGQAGASAKPAMTVYLTPTCGCCGQWVDYVEREGFDVTAREVDQAELNSIKEEAGLDWGLASCHTAFVGDYVVEGHVPAREIRRLLDEQPAIAGISVPGMPIGSPGMEMGDRLDPYDVVAFTRDGSTEVFARYHQD